MKLYLIQHAKAKSEKEDMKRPLNEEGIKDLKKIGVYILDFNISVAAIYHSVKLRAKQTAQILSDYIKAKEGIFEVTGLEPDADINKWYQKLISEEKDIAIVGHLPYLSKLASKLIYGNENKKVIDFKQGCILCLENEKDLWVIKYMIVP